jgi:hypothetical protein
VAEVKTDQIRDTFTARFGEEQAAKIEEAAQAHYAENETTLAVELPFLRSPHGRDNFGSSPFRYWFLLAIGHECVTRFADEHGITVPESDLRAWALGDGQLGDHDGDIPDYVAIISGRYDGWVTDD